MLGEIFECEVCGVTYHAGITHTYKCDVLPEATFYDTGDERGMWLRTDHGEYCGPCSDENFPEILKDGVKFVHKYTICF